MNIAQIINKKLRNISIKRRLLFLLLFQSIITLLWCSYFISVSINEERTNSSFHTIEMLNNIISDTNEAYQLCNMITKYPVVNSSNASNQSYTYKHLANPDMYPDKLKYYKDADNNAKAFLRYYSSLYLVLVSDVKGNIIYSSRNSSTYTTTITNPESAWMQYLFNSEGHFKLFSKEDFSNLNIKIPEEAIWGGRSIMALSPFRTIGIIYSCIDMTNTVNYFMSSRICEDQTLGVFDNKGKLLIGNINPDIYSIILGQKDKATLKGGNIYNQTIKVNNSRNDYYYSISENGIMSVIETPSSVAILSALKKQIAMLVFVVLLLSSSLIIARLLVNSINKPLHHIIASCKDIQADNFVLTIEDDGKDEIHQLIETMNVMSKEITDLIQQVYQKSLLQTKTELQMLRSQINPHFMYNTLETIRATAIVHGNDELAQMAFLLGKNLRFGISNQSTYVTVKEEVENLEYYLQLQKIHFKEKLEYLIQIEPALYDIKIIKLLLQPLVENAIYHGTSLLEGNGFISIYGYLEDTTIVFQISDNGPGISEERVALINDYINGKNDSLHNIGLKNVNRRIHLNYGDTYGITLKSVKGRGTLTTLTVGTQIDGMEVVSSSV